MPSSPYLCAGPLLGGNSRYQTDLRDYRLEWPLRLSRAFRQYRGQSSSRNWISITQERAVTFLAGDQQPAPSVDWWAGRNKPMRHQRAP